MPAPKPVLVLGDLSVGLSLSDLSGHPRRGTPVQVGAFTFTVAGSAARVAGALARLGRRAELRGRVGDDAPGEGILGQLDRRGVDVTKLKRAKGEATGIVLTLGEGDEPSTIYGPGATASTTPSDLGPVAWSRYAHLHVASPFLQPGLLGSLPALLRRARAAKVTTSLDVGWDPAGRWNLEPFRGAIDVLFIDRRVAKTITRASQCRVAARKLADRALVTVLRRDVKGAMAVTGADEYLTPDYAADPVDSCGAGDALAAGFLDGWLEGHRLSEVLPYASACAAASTSQAGGFDGQPTRAEAFKVLRSALGRKSR
jgi:sugar/nucleoside kinase (ribokinase family)